MLHSINSFHSSPPLTVRSRYVEAFDPLPHQTSHLPVQWVTCEASAADPDYDPIALPTLIQYKAGDTTDVLVQLRSPLGPRAPLTLDDTVDALKR